MREEDYADIPDDVMAEYFAARGGCCDTYCGGRCWERDEGDNDSGEEE